MAKYRRGRINDEMAKELAMLLRDVKDPRIEGAMVSITGVEVSADLKYARVHFSALRDDERDIKKGLVSAQGFLRRGIATRMNLRITPEFTFEYDSSIKHGAHISELLHSIEHKESEENTDGE